MKITLSTKENYYSKEKITPLLNALSKYKITETQTQTIFGPKHGISPLKIKIKSLEDLQKILETCFMCEIVPHDDEYKIILHI